MRSASENSEEELKNFLEGSSRCSVPPAAKIRCWPTTACLHTGPLGVLQVSPSQALNIVELVLFSHSLTLISTLLCHLADLLGREVSTGQVSGGSGPPATETQSLPEAT